MNSYIVSPDWLFNSGNVSPRKQKKKTKFFFSSDGKSEIIETASSSSLALVKRKLVEPHPRLSSPQLTVVRFGMLQSMRWRASPCVCVNDVGEVLLLFLLCSPCPPVDFRVLFRCCNSRSSRYRPITRRQKLQSVRSVVVVVYFMRIFHDLSYRFR